MSAFERALSREQAFLPRRRARRQLNEDSKARCRTAGPRVSSRPPSWPSATGYARRGYFVTTGSPRRCGDGIATTPLRRTSSRSARADRGRSGQSGRRGNPRPWRSRHSCGSSGYPRTRWCPVRPSCSSADARREPQDANSRSDVGPKPAKERPRRTGDICARKARFEYPPPFAHRRSATARRSHQASEWSDRS